MKNLIFLFLVAITANVFAQSGNAYFSSQYDIPAFEIDSETQMVIYTDVVKVDGSTKDSLYAYTQRWIKKHFKSVTSVMQVQDPAKGIIEGRHSFYVNKIVNDMETKGDLIKYTFTIAFRDGRYKYTITKINVQKTSYFGIENWLKDDEKLSDETIESYLQQIDDYMQKFITSMQDGIKPIPPKKEEAW